MTIFSSNGDAIPIAAFKFRPLVQSLVRRDFLLTTVWSIIAILMIGFFISNMYRKSVESHLHDLLRAELYHIIDAVKISDQGVLAGSPQLGDLRFTQPKTGWYWLVEPSGDLLGKPVVSISLGAYSLPVVSEMEVPFDQNYERFYNVTDAFGNRVEVAETQVVLDRDGRVARFRVAGNTAVVEDDVRDFSYGLYLALAGFGVGSLIGYALTRRTR